MVPRGLPTPAQMCRVPNGASSLPSPMRGLHSQLQMCAERNLKERVLAGSVSSWSFTVGSSGGKGSFMQVACFASHCCSATIFLRPRGNWGTSRILEALRESSRLKRVAGWWLASGDQEVVTGSQDSCERRKAGEQHGQEHSFRSRTAWVPALALPLAICMTLTKSLHLFLHS